MNRARELMASAVTAVKPSAKVKLFEYNPYNLALGLFGAEGMEHQEAKTLTDEVYTVVSVPGIIQLQDADGKTYYNCTNVTVKPQTPVPAKIVFNGTTSAVYTDAAGGTITADVGTYSATTDERIFITVKTAPTASGDLSGLAIEVKEGVLGTAQPFNVATTSTTKDFTLTSGVKLTVAVKTAKTFTAGDTIIEADLTASTTTYKAGKDYTFEEQSGKAGFLKINAGGAISENDKILVSASVPEQTFVTVSGSNAGVIEGQLMYISDANAGPNVIVEAWDVKVTPDGELSGLISSDFGSYSLSFEFLSSRQLHPDHPFYKVTYVDKAAGTEVAGGTYDPMS